MLHPASIQGRIVAIGLVLILVAATWQVILDPVVSAYLERSDQIDRLEHEFTEYARRAGGISELRAQGEELKLRQGGKIGLIADGNVAIAGATLQSTVRRLFDAHGVSLRSLQPLAARPDSGLQRVAVRADATIPSNRLVDLLYGVEASTPYLFIGNLELRVPDTSARDDDKGHAQVGFRLEIAGYMRAGTP